MKQNMYTCKLKKKNKDINQKIIYCFNSRFSLLHLACLKKREFFVMIFDAYIMSIFEKQGMGNPAIPQHPPTITTHNCKMIHCILMLTYTRDVVMQLNIEKTT